MSAGEIAYFAFGALLLVALGWLTAHYSAKKRHEEVERAKYRMLDDDDHS